MFTRTNSDKGFLSFEPSAYVTTTLSSASLVIDWIREGCSCASTNEPFLSAKRSSGLFWEYSNLIFSLTLANSVSVTFEASVTATLSASAGVLISYFRVCGLRMTLTAVGSAAVPPSPLASAPSLSTAFTKRHPNGVPPFWIAASNFSFVKFPSGAGVPVYVITVGFSAVAVVSEVNLLAVNPYWVSCLFVSPATSLNDWLLPLLNSALASLPLSSLTLISKEFTSDA